MLKQTTNDKKLKTAVNYLHHSLANPDDQENIVSEDSSEHISLLQHSRIDLIKELHKHKRCEHNRGVLSRQTESV